MSNKFIFVASWKKSKSGTAQTSQIERLQGGKHADGCRERMKLIGLKIQHLQWLQSSDIHIWQRADVIAV